MEEEEGEGEGGEEKEGIKGEQFKKRQKQKMMIKGFFSEFFFSKLQVQPVLEFLHSKQEIKSPWKCSISNLLNI